MLMLRLIHFRDFIKIVTVLHEAQYIKPFSNIDISLYKIRQVALSRG